MERTPEPELMDDPAHARAYAQADFAEPHEAFVRYFKERFPAHAPRHVLDLGCGAADVTIRFARAYAECPIVALDGAAPMIELARSAVAAAGLDRRIELQHARLPGAPLAAAACDTIISNSLLHHLAAPQTLWDTVQTCAANGAAVFVMDLQRPASRARATALVEQYAANESAILKIDFYHSLLAAYTPDEIRDQLARAGLRLNVETPTDRHLIAHGRILER